MKYIPQNFLCHGQCHQLHTKLRHSECHFLTRYGLHDIYVMCQKQIPQEFVYVCHIFEGVWVVGPQCFGALPTLKIQKPRLVGEYSSHRIGAWKGRHANPDTLALLARTPTRKRFPHSTAYECLKAFFRHASVFKKHRHAVYHCLKEVQKPFRHASVFKTRVSTRACLSFLFSTNLQYF